MKGLFTPIAATIASVLVPINNVVAATSNLNNNVRIFEDTIWLAAFTLIVVAGMKLRKLSLGGVKAGYWLLVFAGLLGWFWKGIGLVKRVLIMNQPEWFFTLTRETIEGLTGIVLAVAFLVLVISIRKLHKNLPVTR